MALVYDFTTFKELASNSNMHLSYSKMLWVILTVRESCTSFMTLAAILRTIYKHEWKRAISQDWLLLWVSFMLMLMNTLVRLYILQGLYLVRWQFNSANNKGMGLTDGEGLERFWSAIRHLIPSLQYSTSFSRLQILSQIAIEHGERVQCTLAWRFVKLFEAAL